MARRRARIGLVSDTHGLVRPEVLAALEGCERIVHAGDVGGPHVLEALEAVAPVTAVRGNVDEPAAIRRGRRKLDPEWAAALPETAMLALRGKRLFVLHVLEALAPEVEADVVISGHSHRPRVERRGGVLYVNPGSVGPRRFSLPVAMAILKVGARVDVEPIVLG